MKIMPGPLASAMSGSLLGTTASHNRYGPYLRGRVIPTVSTTTAALAAKARFGEASSAWGNLTAANRLAWKNWAAVNPVNDALGVPQILQANAAFIRVNAILDLVDNSQIDDPPLGTAAVALDTLALTADIGTGTFDIAFTATPLGAAEHLIVRAAVVNSAGINYVENLYRVIVISAAAQASPLDIQTEVEALFGTLVVGQTVHVSVQVVDTDVGLPSARLDARAVVIDTP